jgi:hypothetical protein
VNGDGGDDLVFGAPMDDQGGGAMSGSAFAVLGEAPPTGGGGPVAYCESGPNAFGPGAEMGWQGSTSAAAGDLVLTVDGAAPRTIGVFFTGGGQTQVPFMRGYLCIERPLRRATSWVPTDRTGSGASKLGSGRCWRRRKTPSAGETWNFQFLYFDRRRGPGKGRGHLNLSDALSVTFTP